MDDSATSDRNVLDRFSRLRQHVRNGVVAPNKPLTLLWALGRMELEEERLRPFAAAEPELREWLGEYAGPKTVASYAFWRLQNDGIWEVVSTGELPPRSGDKEPRITALRNHAAGGFTETFTRGSPPMTICATKRRCCSSDNSAGLFRRTR